MLRWNSRPLIGWKWSRDFYKPMRMLKFYRSVNLRWNFLNRIGSWSVADQRREKHDFVAGAVKDIFVADPRPSIFRETSVPAFLETFFFSVEFLTKKENLVLLRRSDRLFEPETSKWSSQWSSLSWPSRRWPSLTSQTPAHLICWYFLGPRW